MFNKLLKFDAWQGHWEIEVSAALKVLIVTIKIKKQLASNYIDSPHIQKTYQKK